jgi:hypothetical protein
MKWFGEPLAPHEAQCRIDEELSFASYAEIVLAASDEVAQALR